MLEVDDHIPSQDLRILTGLTHGLDRTTWQTGSAQGVDPFLLGFFKHHRLDQGAELSTVLHPVGIGPEALVLRPVLLSQDTTKFAPHVVIATRHIDVSVFARVGLIGGNGWMLVTHASGALAG